MALSKTVKKAKTTPSTHQSAIRPRVTTTITHTIGEPLRVIILLHAKQRIERVVCRDDKARDIGQELAGNVEEDERATRRDQFRRV